MITTDQRKRYWVEWNAVLEVRPDLTREAFHAQHNLPASTKDFEQCEKHFDTFLAACRAITQPDNLKPQLRALDQPKARLLHKILVEQAAQLRALGHTDPSISIGQISSQKFYGRKPADLSANKRPPRNEGDAPRPSELEMLMFTVARMISEQRQEKGWTVHELLWQSGLGKTCTCADCKRSTPRRNRREEVLTATADNVPF